jgi:hypothetical protein
MKAILIHLSPHNLPINGQMICDKYVYNTLPSYANICVNQCTKYFHDPVVIDNQYVIEHMRDDIKNLYDICLIKYPTQSSNAFWFTTMARLFVLYHYCKHNSINEFIHLEYDNLIYSEMNELKKLKPSLYFTSVGPYIGSAGFVYCNSLSHLEKFIVHLTKLINTGEQILYNDNIVPHFLPVSEMVMIDLIYRGTQNVIEYLPTLPLGVGSNHFNELGILFDGASYGQYIGGTNNGHSKGFCDPNHYVGQNISNNTINVLFQNKKPYTSYNGKLIPIVNLHIHSKQLELYSNE